VAIRSKWYCYDKLAS